MASCVPLCRNKKFSRHEIGQFSYHIRNVLNNNDAREIFGKYLQETQRRDLMRVFSLWKDAEKCLREGKNFPESEMLDQIDYIDDFRTYPFLSISENDNKLNYVKQECAGILNKVLSVFLSYLEQHHQQ